MYDFRTGERSETKSRKFIRGKNLRPFGVHSTAELKDFAQFHGDSVNLFDVGPTCLPA